MSRFVIDVGVALEIAAGTIAPSASHRLLAPTLLRSQVLESLYQQVRNGERETAQALELNAGFGKLKIRYLGDAVLRRRAWDLAAKLGLPSTHKAEYLALTQLQADALVTEDSELIEAARGLIDTAPTSALLD